MLLLYVQQCTASDADQGRAASGPPAASPLPHPLSGCALLSLLHAAPLLAGGLAAAMWAIWALGVLALILLGAGLHLTGLLRRRTSHRLSRRLGQRISG